MKKVIIILAAAALPLVLVPLLAGAQTTDPTPTPAPITESGWRGYGPMHSVVDQTTLERVAELFGLTTEELTAQLEEGKTLLEIATAQGVTQEALVAAIVAPHQEHLALAVKYGYLTQEQADELLTAAQTRAAEAITQANTGTTLWTTGDLGEHMANMPEQCTDMMSGEAGTGMMGGGMMGGSGMGGGMMSGDMGGMMSGGGMGGGMMSGGGMMNGGGMMGGTTNGGKDTTTNRGRTGGMMGFTW